MMGGLTGRPSELEWLAMMSLAAVGAAAGALAPLVLYYWGGVRPGWALVVFAGLLVISTIPLWLKESSRLRATAIGWAAALLCATYVVLVWNPWTMDAEAIAHAKSQALALGHPTFYLGDQVEGHSMSEYYLDPSQASFFYGYCHWRAWEEEGGCSDFDVTVFTSWVDVTIGGDAIAGCTRQEPVAGVPTVSLDYGLAGSEEVVLFTGDSEITIEGAAASSLEDELRIARQIRMVGQSQAAVSLPQPRPEILAYIEKNCALAP